MFHRVDFVRKAGSGEARRSVTIPVPPPETAATRDPALRPGLPAPKTEGADSDGKPVGLADLRGKAVVLVFCSPNCPPCKDFHGRAGELYKGLEGRSFAILEVMGADTVEAAREAARAADPPWPVLCDGEPDEDSIQARWKVEAYPTFWLIDPEGRIVAGPRLRPPVASEVEDLLRRAGMGLP
jgi:peroxiredoxin